MINTKLFTGFLKHIANKLWAVITSDDRAAVCFKKLPFPQGLLEVEQSLKNGFDIWAEVLGASVKAA